jgi:hypothetical protein
MSAGGEAVAKKQSLGSKAKSFFGGVKDALKDAATIDLSFDNQEARLKGTVQSEEGSRELCIFSSTVSSFVRRLNLELLLLRALVLTAPLCRIPSLERLSSHQGDCFCAAVQRLCVAPRICPRFSCFNRLISAACAGTARRRWSISA